MSTITLTGGREMVNEARALELIDKIEISTIATSVNLSNKSFSPAAASIIIDRIKQFPSILYVNLSDVIAGTIFVIAFNSLSYTYLYQENRMKRLYKLLKCCVMD